MASDTRRHPIAQAVEDTLNRLGRSQAWLGQEVARIEGRPNPYTQASVSGWLDRMADQPPGRVFAIEQALGMRPGRLSRPLGYLPADARPARSPEDLLAEDDRINPAVLPVILSAIEAARQGGR